MKKSNYIFFAFVFLLLLESAFLVSKNTNINLENDEEVLDRTTEKITVTDVEKSTENIDATLKLLVLEGVSVPKESNSKVIFFDRFDKSRTIEESGQIHEGIDPYWSLSSGAYFFIKDGVGKTIQGSLSNTDKWAKMYNKENEEDTDGGIHPQNVFRLQFVKEKAKNYTQEAWFKIEADNFSDSEYRNQSNGILFFNRYIDSNNLYYTGLRVDGHADIKKKYKGKYYTFTHIKIIKGDKYDRDTNPTLLPNNTWIGLKTEVKNIDNDSVQIKFFVDIGKTGVWTPAGEVMDDGTQNGQAITSSGLTGIRTDFMDVIFDDYSITEL